MTEEQAQFAVQVMDAGRFEITRRARSPVMTEARKIFQSRRDDGLGLNSARAAWLVSYVAKCEGSRDAN
jgi:hypothetical protein